MASRNNSRGKKKSGNAGRGASRSRSASSSRRASASQAGSRAGRGARARSASRRSANDATQLLIADHERVKSLLDKFEKARQEDQKERLAAEICMELTVHAQVEEELFYPAARQALGEDDADLVAEAKVEHDSAKQLIAQIESGSPGDEMYDAKVKVLGEYVKHHVEEEEGELFPKVRRTELDLEGLGRQMQERKQELQARESNGGRRRSQPFTESAGATR